MFRTVLTITWPCLDILHALPGQLNHVETSLLDGQPAVRIVVSFSTPGDMAEYFLVLSNHIQRNTSPNTQLRN